MAAFTGPTQQKTMFYEEIAAVEVPCHSLSPYLAPPVAKLNLAGKGKNAKKKAKKQAEMEREKKMALAAKKNAVLPKARGGATLTFVEATNKIYLVGGANRQGEAFGMESVYVYDLQTDEWAIQSAEGDLPEPRSGHSAVSVGNLLYVFGGLSRTQKDCFNDVHVLDTSASPMLWTLVRVDDATSEVENLDLAPSVAAPLPRNSHTATLVFPHLKSGSASTATNDKENSMADQCDEVCDGKANSDVVNKDRVYMVVFGGGSPSTGPMNDVHILDVTAPGQCRWVATTGGKVGSTIQGTPPDAREMHSAVFIPSGAAPNAGGSFVSGNIYIFGGRGAESLHRDCAVLNIETMTWVKNEFITTAISRLGHVAVPMTPQHMAIVGGFDGAKVCQDLMILNLKNKQWTEASLKPKPLTERFAHSAAFNLEKRQVYIFGGSNAKQECNDLIRIDLSGIKDDFDAEKANTDGDVVFA